MNDRPNNLKFAMSGEFKFFMIRAVFKTILDANSTP